MNRVADLVEERRDDLALTLTLDQGKPLHAEAYDEVDELVVYWRMAAADATRLAGSHAAFGRRLEADPRVPSAARCRRRDHTLELAVHDARRAHRSRTRRRERGGLGAGAVDDRSAR